MEQIKELFKNPISYIVILMLTFAGDKVLEYVQKGAESDVTTLIDNRIKAKMSDSQLIETLLNSKQVEEFKEEAGQELKNSILSMDSSKLSIPSYLGKELGLRDEDVLPFLAEFMKQVKDGNIATKEDLEELRPRRNPNRNDF